MSGVVLRRLDIARVRQSLERYALRLGSRPEVRSVILFGSLARGDYTGTSDADLLIVVDAATEPFVRRGTAYADPFLPVPVDLFVYTADEVEQALDAGAGIVTEAFKTGEVLFERGSRAACRGTPGEDEPMSAPARMARVAPGSG